MTAPSNANTSGLAEIISDDEILRVHGHANFGSDITPREVVNEGVLKYAFGHCSGHTQLCILMEHGLITKPRPGRYEASLTKKGKRYARALGGYQNAVTAASAQARIADLEARVEYLRGSRDGHAAHAHTEFEARVAAEARADRLAKGIVQAEILIDDAIKGIQTAPLSVVTDTIWTADPCPMTVVEALQLARAALQQETQP